MLLQREPDHEAGAAGRLDPHIASMVYNRLAGKRQAQAQAVVFAGRGERLKQLVANLRRDAVTGIFDFDHYVVISLRGYDFGARQD